MSKCVICSSETREKATTNGKPLCDICGSGSIPDWMIDDPWFSEDKRKELAAMLRSRYYCGLSTELSAIWFADQFIQEYRAFEANAEGRDNSAADALEVAEWKGDPFDTDFLRAVSKAVGRSPDAESREYIEGLQTRGKIRLDWDRQQEPPGSFGRGGDPKPFVRLCRWVKVQE